MTKFFLIILVLFSTLSCVSNSNAGGLSLNGVNPNGVNLGHSEHVITVEGDSITLGTGNSATLLQGGYRQPLYNLLSAHWPTRFVGTILPQALTAYANTWAYHSGINGQTTTQIDNRMASDLVTAFPYPIPNNPIVLIHAGTNDLGGDLNNAVTKIMSMIDKTKARDAGASIYVSLIIPTQDALNADVITFNGLLHIAIFNKQGTTTRLHEIDDYSTFMDVNNCPTLATCMSDDYHPNVTGYNVMAATRATAILANE